MNINKKRRKYSIINKRNSKYGRISLITGIIAVVTFLVAIGISYMNRGAGGTIVGLLGVVTFIIAMIGFIFGMVGFREEDKLQLYCWIGSILNVFMWLGIIGIILAFL